MFKRLLMTTVAVLAVGLLVASPAGAAVIAEETFTYADGEINGKSGGTGWGAAWSAWADPTQVVSGALQVNGGGGHSFEASRTLDAAESGDRYFVSFDFNFSAGLDSNDFILLWIGDSAIAAANRVNTGTGMQGTNGSFVRISNTTAYDSVVPTQGTTYHIVAEFVKETSGAAQNFTYARVFINPDGAYGDNTWASQAAATTPSLSSFDQVGITTGANLDASDVVIYDNLTIATEWSDVVVPEPATLSLLGIGGLLTVIRKRR